MQTTNTNTKTAKKIAKVKEENAKIDQHNAQVCKEKTGALPKAKPYAAILQKAIKGDYGQVVQRFYLNALNYHFKKGTKFPRVNTRELIPANDVPAWLGRFVSTGIPAGDKVGQRIFDQMIVEAYPVGVITK